MRSAETGFRREKKATIPHIFCPPHLDPVPARCVLGTVRHSSLPSGTLKQLLSSDAITQDFVRRKTWIGRRPVSHTLPQFGMPDPAPFMAKQLEAAAETMRPDRGF